jgi:hypothetical protein
LKKERRHMIALIPAPSGSIIKQHGSNRAL